MMRKLKLGLEMLAVNTFATHGDATPVSGYRGGRAGPETNICSVYPSFCAMECESETIDRSNSCHLR